MMTLPARRLAVVTLLVALTAALAVASPTPAYADRCQPEELVTGPGTSPMDERDSPVCYLLVDVGMWGFICNGQVPTTAADCVGKYQTGDPYVIADQIEPGYQPNLGAQYQPDAERIFCNAFNWTLDRTGQTGTCVYTAHTR